ncbi:MAG: 3-deoxy-7-phosphoheptulonate synthase [Candidatus Woesearchaeota archaeon]|nr:3-deoxy-7-phosphoheptulonate synthase [Candidatus Woesearchaeota archaeon]
MIIIAEKNGTLDALLEHVHALDFKTDVSTGDERVVIGLIGDTRALAEDQFSPLPGVLEVRRITSKYKLVSRQFRPTHTVSIGRQVIGDVMPHPLIIAGPCAVETEEQALRTFAEIAPFADVFRGFLYKPRTSPYEFQGLREEGIHILQEVKRLYPEKPMVQEVLDPRHLDVLNAVTDVYQIGMRNMYNYELLQEVGRTGKPIILKRNCAAKLEEWLLAAEYIATTGNMQIILCERGIRTSLSGEYSRNTPDLGVIPAIKTASCLPIIFDPSHSTGHADMVEAMSSAALQLGAHGLEIDVMPVGYDRTKLRVDGAQAITAVELERVARAARK